MRGRLIALCCALLPLQGCGVGAFVIYDGSKNESRDVIGRIMVEKMPGVDPDAAATCVVKGMTYREIITMGTSDINPITAKHRATVEKVIVRPEVANCIAALPEAVASP
jgi:hypothetical protein